MSEGYEYNLLTQELLLQGYTAEHYPDYVRIGNGRLGKSSLEIHAAVLYIPKIIWKRKHLCLAVVYT